MRFLQNLERMGRDVSSDLLGHIFKVQKISLPELSAAFQQGEIRKILLVRNYQGMGDLLCASPVMSSLKSRFPKASIHFLANTFNAAALKNNPRLDKIWEWNEGRKADPLQWIYFRQRLRRERFDLAIVLSGNALSLTAILLADLSGARWVIGYDTQSYGHTWGQSLYSYQVPRHSVIREIDQYAGLIEGIGIPCANRVPEFFITSEDAAFAKDYWAQQFPTNGRPIVGVFLGGKVDRPDRIWPAKNYAVVARRLVESNRCGFLAIAPPLARGDSSHKRQSTFWLDEAVHVREFHEAFGQDFPVFRSRQLGHVGAILQKLDLFICPDGGMMHLAAALRVPTLTLFFGTNPEIWHPPVPTSSFLRALANDPDALEPDIVVLKAVEILKHYENH